MHLTISSGRWRPFCLDFNVLITEIPKGLPILGHCEQRILPMTPNCVTGLQRVEICLSRKWWHFKILKFRQVYLYLCIFLCIHAEVNRQHGVRSLFYQYITSFYSRSRMARYQMNKASLSERNLNKLRILCRCDSSKECKWTKYKEIAYRYIHGDLNKKFMQVTCTRTLCMVYVYFLNRQTKQ